MVKLTEVQRRGLIECCAMGDGSFYSRHLSGTKQERATSNLHSLRKLGYLEAVKEGTERAISIPLARHPRRPSRPCRWRAR